MPLLRKEPFIKNSVPQGLKPDDEVFHCPITDEIFTDYEKFFERIILCNSLVWACSVTGRSGLTYQEAAASENHIKEQLLMFPDPLKRPILFLVTLTRRRKINDVLDDISSFMKDRYFVGETVEALASTGNVKKLYKVMKVMIVKEKNVDINGIKPVLSPNKPISSLNLSTSPNKSTSPDKSASQNLLTSPVKSSTVETSSSGPNVADMFEYALQEISNQITSVRVLKGSKLFRKKGSFNRDKCKIFIRDNCYIDSSDSLWKVKEGAIKKYRLNSLSFDVIFTGPPPIFEASESRKNSSKLNGDVIDLTSDEAGSPRKISGAGLKNEESNRIKCAKLQAKKDMEKLEEELRKMREAAAAKKLEKTNKEESKKKVMKDKEKDKKMEEKKKERDNKVTEMQYRMEWNKARDDLECDDLKDLPTSTPLPMNLFLTKDLGDVLYVMEFIKSFQEILNLDINKTFSLEKFCDCLNSKDVDGWFGRLVVSLMSALFTIHKEEITVKVLEEKKSSEIDESGEHCQIFKAAKHSLNIYGCIIQDLPLDVYSISEIVRLYFTASSGTACSTTNPRFVQHMNKQTLFELSPDDKLEVLIQVSHQLLNTSKVRTEIEDRQEAIKITQKNLKMHQFNCMKRSKDESSFWAKKKQEECMKGFLKDGKQNDSKGDEPNSDKTDSLVRKSARSANANVIPDENFDNLPTENLDWSKISETEKSQMRDWEQRKEKELMDELRRLQVGSPAVLGFDRTHRRYWMMTCIAGILVEDESDVSFCLSRSISSPTKLKVINQAKRTTPPPPSSTTTTLPSSSSTATLTKTNASNNDSKSEEGERSDKENVPLEDHAESQPFKCPLTSVHEQIATKGLVRWSIYNSTEQINILMNSLNQRGFRESKLLNSLKEHKTPIIEGLEYLKPTYEFLLKFGQLKQIPQNGSTKSSLITNHIQEILKDDGNMLISATDEKEEAANDDIECHLKESLVDLEDRLYAGALGKLKGIDRNEWRQYLEDGNYEAISNMPSGVNDEDEDNACDTKELDQFKELKGLMSALLQIEKMIETRFIDVHLGQQNKKSKSKQSKKKKETEPVESDDDASSTASQHGQHHRSEELHTWKASLKSSRNISQLYLLMHVLESSVTWSKSALNARCRICRKKGDGEQMMLCDECDKGHHTYCLKPPVKVIPEGDWYCPWCRPLPAVETPRKKVAQDEDEENEDEEMGVSDNESEEVERDDEADSVVSGSNESKVEDNDDDEGEDDKTDEDCRRTEKLEISKKYFYGKKNFKKSSIENSKNHKTIPKNFNSHLNLRKNKRLSLNKCPDKKLKMKKYSSTSVIDVGRRTRTTRQNYVEDEEEEEEEEDDDEDDFSEKDGPMSKRIQLKECTRQERRGTKRKNVFDAHPDSPCLKKRNSYVIARESITRHSSPSSSSSYNCDPMKFCEDLVSQLMNQEDAWPFLKPVSKKDAFDYLDIIKSPMDFSTIRNKINSFKYGHHGQLIDDVRLIFRNCQEYNAVSSFFYKASQKLSDYFEKQLKQSPLSLSTKSCSIVINGKNKDSQQVNGLSNGNNLKKRKIHYTGDGDSDSNDYDGLPTKTRNLRKRS